MCTASIATLGAPFLEFPAGAASNHPSPDFSPCQWLGLILVYVPSLWLNRRPRSSRERAIGGMKEPNLPGSWVGPKVFCDDARAFPLMLCAEAKIGRIVGFFVLAFATKLPETSTELERGSLKDGLGASSAPLCGFLFRPTGRGCQLKKRRTHFPQLFDW